MCATATVINKRKSLWFQELKNKNNNNNNHHRHRLLLARIDDFKEEENLHCTEMLY